MADHRAEQIVARTVVTVTGLTTTGSRAYRGRAYPLQTANLPGLCVFQGPDRPQSDTSSYGFIDSDLTVYIDIYVKTVTSQVDTLLNQIRKELVIALSASYTQGLSFVIDTVEGDADEPDLNGESDQPVARLRTSWVFRYRRSRTDPSA